MIKLSFSESLKGKLTASILVADKLGKCYKTYLSAQKVEQVAKNKLRTLYAA